MKTFKSNAGVDIPALIYGTAWKKERTAELVAQALQAGFRGIDTACQPKHYFEPGVGEGIEKSGVGRGEIFLQTKFTEVRGQDPNNIPYDPSAPLREKILQSFEVSKRNLKTDVIDSLVLHSPMETLELTKEAWSVFEELVGKGEVRQLGISNCYHPGVFKALFEFAKVKPSVLQNRFYADSGYDVELREFCRAQNIYYQSFWTLTANPHILAGDIARKLSAKYGLTPAQVFFHCLIRSGFTPLTGTTSEVHMREDLAAIEAEMSAEDVDAFMNQF